MQEWLRCNALGSFAMGTGARTPARKYHGLFMLRRPGLSEPLHILSDVNEVLHIAGRTFELGSWHYQASDHPHGFVHRSNDESESPTYEYTCAGITLRRNIEFVENRNELLIHYKVMGAGTDAELRLSPQLTGRGIHQLGYENPFLDGRAHATDDGVQFRLYRGFPPIDMSCTPPAEFIASGFWNRQVKYPEEGARGYPDKEDLFCPGYFRVPLKGDATITLRVRLPGAFSPNEQPQWDGPSFLDPGVQEFANRLSKAARQFVYFQADTGRPGVLAGFPWFGEWGRDTLIALPGLLLETARTDVAIAIMDRYANSLRHGLIPNLLGETAETSDWFSVDASLWFIRCVQDIHTQEGKGVAGRWFEAVREILEALRNGSVDGVCVTENGLLSVDLRPRPGTWMDAQIDGHGVTHRAPFAIELNALFYNAVEYALRVTRQSGDSDFVTTWTPIRDALKRSILETFWLEDEGYLADAYDGHVPDKSLRPNQLIAASLPFKAISKAQAARMLDNVEHYLRTPMGLRTLAPDQPGYVGELVGSQAQRDLGYHNGTVWAWLLGPYVDTVNFVRGDEAAAGEVKQIVKDFTPHLDDACIGQISEIFDGNAPHTPRGAPAQAWSVSELLRVACRYSPRNDERSRRMKAVLQDSAGAAT
ncbi:MAG: glycogen debranching enzyme family protein [Planctomycetes bacterium]|nr:glycogen debranching enzyme family protein [Planctomycetota bacterium]